MTSPSNREVQQYGVHPANATEGQPGSMFKAMYKPAPPGATRTFETGATRDTDRGKPDYEGYLSPLVIERFGQYMLKHQVQSDGTMRPGDNWQKGIPLDAYMKSAWRHFMDLWMLHRQGHKLSLAEHRDKLEEALCALMFNAMGYLHETLKGKEVL